MSRVPRLERTFAGRWTRASSVAWVSVTGDDVLAAAELCRAALEPELAADWSVPVPGLEFTVAGVVAHAANAALWYAVDLWSGRADAVMARLFPWHALGPGDDPWQVLLWANGRIDLEGRPRQARWRWHCAPLSEWDGAVP